MVKLAIRILAAFPTLFFLFTALRWLIDPQATAAGLGMPLLPVSQASTQIGDIGALFVAVAGMGAYAQLPGKSSWFYPPAWLLLAAPCSGAVSNSQVSVNGLGAEQQLGRNLEKTLGPKENWK